MILIKHMLIRETSLKWNSSAKFHEGLDFMKKEKDLCKRRERHFQTEGKSQRQNRGQ